MKKMFCFQCEQTAKESGCTDKSGVCGKNEKTALLQDELTGALIGLAYAIRETDEPITKYTNRLLIRGLFSTLTNVNFDPATLKALIHEVRREKVRLITGNRICDAINHKKYEQHPSLIWNAQEDIRSLKSIILFGLRGMAAYAYHTEVLGFLGHDIIDFICKALLVIGYETELEKLHEMILEVGKANLSCMEALDHANVETYGIPQPETVSLTIEKGPFIIVSGHDLHDLYHLLKQTEGTSVSVYTHGEMLPAHGYPELNKFKSLKGHFGTAWQNQHQEFDYIPAPIVFTSNCLMPPRESYQDRVYTTGVVSYPGIPHIGENKDFTDVIMQAQELGGYNHTIQNYGLNNGTTITTGYSYRSILSIKDQLLAAIRIGHIKHIFLIGGCDGAKTGRNYYTEFVSKCPKDSIILTLACGKFRFNDMDLGEIDGIPRLMDLGQCNDAYGAIQIAKELAKLLDCEINDLPLSIVLSWYEQKAIAILLSLLYLGIKGILLGPTLPAFLSSKVRLYMMQVYHIRPITYPEYDLEKLLNKNEDE